MRRSKHALSNQHLTSLGLGTLVPVQLLETLPGDSFQMHTSALVRMAPMLSPPMHPVSVRLHHWFVPFRLLWDKWEDFITGGPDGYDASAFPTVSTGEVTAGSLANYLGLPISATLPAVSALPFRAYQLIWNEWYRDEDLQTKTVVSTASGVDTTTNRSLQRVSWAKDYFTTARPWEQKGPSVSIPGGANEERDAIFYAGTNKTAVRQFQKASSPTRIQPSGSDADGTDFKAYIPAAAGGTINVNDLRESLAIQRFEEARAMYGSRYSEYLRAIGVRSSDARLQRPEYLGGGIQNVQFSEVMQTAFDGPDGSETPVGTLRGHGITAMKSNRVRRFFEEHGYVLTFISILPKSIYMDGIARTWNRRSKYDFWQKELENLGQQAILNKEIYAAAVNPEGTFGYVDRYDEYRKQWSRITGEFATSQLDYWHFGRKFAAEPALNSTFVSAVPPLRPFASTISDPIYLQVYNSVKARRLVSSYAKPMTF